MMVTELHPIDVLAPAVLRFQSAMPVPLPIGYQAAPTPTPGFGLATAVMALLLLALLYALVASSLRAVGRTVPILPAWSWIAIPILAVAGLGVAGYLTYVETRNVAAVCGPVGDCNAVQSSPYARLFGMLPVGVLGVLGYVAMLAAWAVAQFGRGRLAVLAPLALFGMALFGVLFTTYLTYLELFVIRAVCIWCLSSAVIMVLVLVVSVGPVMQGDEGEDDAAAPTP